MLADKSFPQLLSFVISEQLRKERKLPIKLHLWDGREKKEVRLTRDVSADLFPYSRGRESMARHEGGREGRQGGPAKGEACFTATIVCV